MSSSPVIVGVPEGSVPLKAASPPMPSPDHARSPDEAPSDALPLLPIPTLEETCARFQEVAAPLLSPKERSDLSAQVEAFRTGPGAELHAKLLEWKPSAEEGSYLERFWYDAYLTGRCSIPVNINPFFVLEEDPTPSRNSQIERATSLIISCLKFHQALKAGKIEQDSVRGTPLCMKQYKDLFHATRIPGADKDRLERFPGARHIVVMCRGQQYWFNVYSADGLSTLPAKEIANNLRMIREDAWSMDAATVAATSVGVLTSENRDVWHLARQELEAADGKTSSGSQSLRVVDSALFVVCLDHTAPHTLAQQSQNCLHGTSVVEDGVQTGTCLNRWYDKTLQLIVCENGSAGVNFEHSHLDGHTVLRFASDVFTDTILRFAQTIRGGLPSLLDPLAGGSSVIDSSPKRLSWRLTPGVQHRIRKAEAKMSDTINRVEVECLEFTGFGKHAIVGLKCSPDGFIQLAFQLAYYRLYGELRSTYETVMTKMYRHGRTEAQRPCTSEAYDFVELFCSDAPTPTKANALRTAVSAQAKGVKLCAKGKGVDRHLYALQCIAAENGIPMPELFASKAWKVVTHNVLSTSNCGNPSLRLFGFGPVVPDGYGIGYLIKNDGVQFCVSSFRRQTQRFIDLLKRSLAEMRALLIADRKLPAAALDELPAGSVALSRRAASDDDDDGAGAGAGAGAGGGVTAKGTRSRRSLSREFSSRLGGPSTFAPHAPASMQLGTGLHPEATVVRNMWYEMLRDAGSPSSQARVLASIATTSGRTAPPVKADSVLDPSQLSAWLTMAADAYVSSKTP